MAMEMYPKMTVLGMMSGTSMDGIDCIIAEIQMSNQYELSFKIIETYTQPIPNDLRNEIKPFIENPNLDYKSLDKKIGHFYSQSASQLSQTSQLDLISIHGQTIYHKERIKSIQIGDPKFIYEKFKTTVVYNFRKNDILVNGTGAPLMPFLDWLFLKDSNFFDITLNIGGISNITAISKCGHKNEVIGFDTGPGMSLIDECCMHYFNVLYDKDAHYSKDGKLIPEMLNELMQLPFIKMDYPKSTGRDMFGKKLALKFIDKYYFESPENILRTFIAFTAKSISENLNKIRNFRPSDARLFISGGGINHPIIIEDLKKYSQIKFIENSNSLNIDPDYKEALLMSVLGYTNINHIPNNMPSVTGANKDVILGEIYK